MPSPQRVLVVALATAGALSPATSAARQDAAPRHCRQLFTVRMAERAARAVYSGTRRVTARNLRLLGYIERCQRNPRAQAYVRSRDRRMGRNHGGRVAHARFIASNPLQYSTASWYTDGGQTASGFHSYYGVADCANYTVNCYPFGTRIEFCYHGCVVAIADDHGPYVAGRDWDLNQNTAQAIGFSGVDTVGWRVVR